ncbi:MAG: hypothetical protein WBQ76_11910 [Candidatus Korobacteraceae bacterium]
MTSADYALLRAFKNLFAETRYLHRKSNLGDWVASYLYEDLYGLNKSDRLAERVRDGLTVVNVQNTTVGIVRRRGDGTFGEAVPSEVPIPEPGFHVSRGPVATIEIGTEVKILAKAMIKQIDRVIGDLVRQAEQFKLRGGNPICVAIVGVNSADAYTSYEGSREFQTDGKKYKHPAQEAYDAIARLRQRVTTFDELLIIPFTATNVPPYPFFWVNEAVTIMEYSALLTRVSREYDRRFR